MATIAELVVKLVGDIGGFTQSMGAAEKHASGFIGNLTGTLGTGLKVAAGIAVGATTAVVGGITAIGKVAFDAAQSLDSAYDTIIIGTGATGAALDTLKADFQAVFTSIPTSAETAGQVIAELNKRLGLTGAPLQDVSKSILEMSRIMGGDALANSQAFGRVMGDWGLSAADATLALDKFFVAGQQTGIGVTDLMQKVVQFGSPLRLMGFSLEESIAMMGKWEKEGVNTELVLGSLRIAAGKFADANIPLREGLNQTMDAIKGAASQSEALGIAMDTFGARAGPDMAAAILEGRFGIDDLVKSMQGAEGAIGKTADATADFPEKLEVLKNKATAALAPLGGVVMDSLGGVLDGLSPLIDDLLPRVAEVIGPVVTSVGGAFSNLFADMAAGETAGNTVSKFVASIAQAFGMSEESSYAFGDSIGAVVESVKGFVENTLLPAFHSVVGWVTENWPTIRSIIEGVFNGVKTVVEQVLVPAFQTVVGWIQQNWPTIRSIIEGVFNAVKTVIDTVLVPAFNFIVAQAQRIIAWVKENWPLIQRTAETVFNAIKNVVTTVFNAVRSVVETVWPIIQTVIETAINAVQGVIKTVMHLINGEWDEAWNTIKATFEGVWNGISSFLTGIWNAIKGTILDGINSVVGFINSNFIDPINAAIRSINSALGTTIGEVGRLQYVAGSNGLLPGTQVTFYGNGVAGNGAIGNGVAGNLALPDFEPITVTGLVDLVMPEPPAIHIPAIIDAADVSVAPAAKRAEPKQPSNITYVTVNVYGADEKGARDGVVQGLRRAGLAVAP